MTSYTYKEIKYEKSYINNRRKKRDERSRDEREMSATPGIQP